LLNSDREGELAGHFRTPGPCRNDRRIPFPPIFTQGGSAGFLWELFILALMFWWLDRG